MVADAKGEEHDEPLPYELRLGWRCQQWNALPDIGGIHVQDYILLYRMSAYMNIHHVVTRWYNLEGKEIHSLTDAERRILKNLQDMGLMFNA